MDKRIVIIGNSWAGKSTLANKLGEKLWIPVHHLDLLFLDTEWKKLSLQDRNAIQSKILSQPQWCIEWNYTDCTEDRITSASHIIILKIPILFCIINVLKRYCKWVLNRKSVWVHQQFRKSLSFNFLFRWIPNYYKHTLPKITKVIEQNNCKDKVQIAHSYKEIDKIFADLTT